MSISSVTIQSATLPSANTRLMRIYCKMITNKMNGFFDVVADTTITEFLESVRTDIEPMLYMGTDIKFEVVEIMQDPVFNAEFTLPSLESMQIDFNQTFEQRYGHIYDMGKIMSFYIRRNRFI